MNREPIGFHCPDLTLKIHAVRNQNCLNTPWWAQTKAGAGVLWAAEGMGNLPRSQGLCGVGRSAAAAALGGSERNGASLSTGCQENHRQQ